MLRLIVRFEDKFKLVFLVIYLYSKGNINYVEFIEIECILVFSVVYICDYIY